MASLLGFIERIVRFVEFDLHDLPSVGPLSTVLDAKEGPLLEMDDAVARAARKIVDEFAHGDLGHGLDWEEVLADVDNVGCYFWMPPPGTVLANPKQPVNINYVYGFSDHAPQRWMPAWAWLLTMMLGLPLLVWWPTHLALRRFFASDRRPRADAGERD